MKISIFYSLIIFILPLYLNAKTWQVGPTRTYTYCSKVASLVQNGDTILIDFATYKNDPQVKWDKNNLYIKGIGGRPRLEAGSIIANDASNGKGIFVISGANVTVDNIEFANAAVIDRNGAGIRQEGANLNIFRCKFVGNEMGILCGNIANCKTTIEYSEFFNGGSTFNPGYQHNIYINHIDTFVFQYNYSHDAIAEGHELKSRATNNIIRYNRIANEVSTDSRTIDLPNGGTAIIVGNIIEQGPNSANTNLFGYGLEGLSNPAPHNVWICNNTFINKKTTGSFIHVQSGTDTLFVKNNIIGGAVTSGILVGIPDFLDSTHNLILSKIADIGFVDPVQYNYHLLTQSPAKNNGISIVNKVNGYELQPNKMYKDTCNFENRIFINTIDIGAFEFAEPTFALEIDPNEINVFPNPTSDFINIESKGYNIEKIFIINSIGEQVLSTNQTNFSIEHLENGLYFLIIQANEKYYTIKLTKL